ncbi:hypothetical protein ACVKXF_002518 [Curtobacterium sp. PvP017]
MHMSHKKRASTAFKSMGAAGLVAATIVSGLSFGAAPATAAPNSATTAASSQAKLVFKNGSTFSAFVPRSEGTERVSARSFSTLAEATAAAAKLSVTAVSGGFFLSGPTSGTCLGTSTKLSGVALHVYPANINASCGTFSVSGGNLLMNGSNLGDVATVRGTSPEDRWVYRGIRTSGNAEFVGDPGPMQPDVPLVASVSTVNHIAKSAVVSGTATPGAKVSIGSQEVEADKTSGAWSITVTGLAAGKNDLVVIQKINSTEYDQKTVSPEIVEGGTLVGVDQGPIELESGETTQVPFVVENRESRTDAKGTVVLNAPDGTTFSEQDTVQGSWRGVGNTAWNASTSIPLTDGRLSNDNTTLTFDADWASERPADVQYRFMVGVTAGDETPEGSSAMEFDFSGTSSKGDFRAQGETTTTVADSENVAAPTGEVEFSDDVTEKATVKGTGAEGATIDLFNGSTKIGTATVENGEWSTTIDPIGAGTHTIRVQQTLGEDVQNVNVEADYRQAAEFTTADNVQFTDGTVTVSGRSSQGAIVKIVTGGKQVDEFTVTAADGTFTRELEGVGSGPIVLTMTAASRGGLETSDTLRAESPVKVEDLTVASHVRGGTFVPGTQAFTGQGTAGTTVTLNPFGFDPRYAAYDVTTTVNQFGEWTINRGLSDTPYALISFKQTTQRGVVNEVLNYDLKPFKEIGEPGDLMITNFKAGDFFTPGGQVFTGIATPGATVIVNPFGFAPQYEQYNITTTADTTTGAWEIRRGLADTVYREFAVKQDPEAEGKVNKIEKITIAATGWVGSPADLTLATTEPTFAPGMVTFSGTATPGTVVTMYPFGDDRYADITTTTVTNAVGNWEIKRNMGNQAFPAVFTQTDAGDKVDRIEHRITPAS